MIRPAVRSNTDPNALPHPALSMHRHTGIKHTMSTERTYIMIKPDGVQRGLVGEIIARFERKGFKLVALKSLNASKDLLNEHYQDLADKPFFAGLVTYMSSGPVIAMVWEGLNAVKEGRKVCIGSFSLQFSAFDPYHSCSILIYPLLLSSLFDSALADPSSVLIFHSDAWCHQAVRQRPWHDPRRLCP